MIVVDTSALVAMLIGEPEKERVQLCMARAGSVLVPVSCLVEIAVLHRIGAQRFHWMEALFSDPNVQVVSVEGGAASLAIDAARRYGKGSGHPAQLNFGDCLSYAVAKYRDLPLLYVGKDFAHTDIRSALAED